MIQPIFVYFSDASFSPQSLRLLRSVLLPYLLVVDNRIWNESWLASFFYKPCNYEFFCEAIFKHGNGYCHGKGFWHGLDHPS
ncbi:hypothetical protein K1719_005837 [Acacia pycnantha]|nr:hypothetical protein K1719_005837 [Acacia pycnantha]